MQTKQKKYISKADYTHNKLKDSSITSSQCPSLGNASPPYFKLELILSVRQAKFINKLDYWLKKCGREIKNLPGKWIYNTIDAWAQQNDCSSSTIKRIIKPLEEQGILLSKKVNARKYNQTKWYSLNYSKIGDLLSSKQKVVKAKKKNRSNRIAQNEPLKYNNNNYTKYSSTKRLEETQQKTVNTMIKLWNEVFLYDRESITAFSTRNNKLTLISILENHFQNDLVQWQNYARMVSNSKFLMGEKETRSGFKAIFSWLIKDEIIETIKGGGYGVGDRKIDNRKKEFKDNRKQTQDIKENLLKRINSRKEIQKFNEYVMNRQYEEDGDKIRLGMYIRSGINAHSILNIDKYKNIKEHLYKEYIFQKHSQAMLVREKQGMKDKMLS